MSDGLKVTLPLAFKFLFPPARYKVGYGGRGAAKSWNFGRGLLIKGTEKPLRILCTREVQTSIKDSVHRLLQDQIAAMGLSDFYTVSQVNISGKNGTEFIFSGLSTQTAESIKSFEGIDIVWVEEANAVSEFSWRILIPTIRKEGSEIWVSFNPDLELDPAYQRFVIKPPPDAVVRYLTYRDNPYFTSVMRKEMEHLKATDYAEYEHVWEGKLKTIADSAVYGPQLLEVRKGGRICKLPIDPSALVHTFWDLGRNDHTAIWFMQEIGPHYRFIDYYENRLQGLDHYLRALAGRLTDDEVREAGITPADNLRRQSYLYGTDFLPHDVDAKILGMDKTRREQLEDAGRKIEVVPRVQELNEGIEAVRRKLPSCWFHEDFCKGGINALSNYIWSFDPDTQTHKRVPVHNWASNGADGFRQFAQGYKTPGPKWVPKPKPVKLKRSPYA